MNWATELSSCTGKKLYLYIALAKKMVDLNRLYLYRMTHIENVPHILEYGVTHATSAHANKSYKGIGDNSIIGTRNEFVLPSGRKLGSYIPFYFGPRMPMLFVIQKGYNGVLKTPAKEIVYCVCSVQKVIDLQLPFLFTDGHAVDGFTTYYEQKKLPDIDELLDFKAINSQYWRNADDLDLKRRKEAEFLVETDIPTTAIVGWVVYNEEAKQRLLALGIPEKRIHINSNYYF